MQRTEEIEIGRIVGDTKLWCIDDMNGDSYLDITLEELKNAKPGKTWEPKHPTDRECFYYILVKLMDGTFLREKIHITRNLNKRTNEVLKLILIS